MNKLYVLLLIVTFSPRLIVNARPRSFQVHDFHYGASSHKGSEEAAPVRRVVSDVFISEQHHRQTTRTQSGHAYQEEEQTKTLQTSDVAKSTTKCEERVVHLTCVREGFRR